LKYLCSVEKIKDITLKEFLKIFPDATLPAVISKDSILDFSRNNIALPPSAIANFISLWDPPTSEFVEYIPCFKFKIEKEITALVYYKAELLKYEYFLVTLDKKGNLMARKVIAGLISDGAKTVQSAATITEDFSVHIAGALTEGSHLFEGNDSKQIYMEIHPNGQIVSINDDDYNDKTQEKKQKSE